MEEIAEGVLRIGLGYVNAYLVITDDGLVLIDTGLPRTHAKLARALVEGQRAAGRVRTVLLTHWHTDHVGGAARVSAASGARVVVHALDAPIVTGERPEPHALVTRLASPLVGRVERTPVDEVLSEDGAFSVPGFTAVHTPGHTDGHVSYLLDRGGGLLFVGDAAGSARGKVRPSPALMTADRPAAAASVAKLASLSFQVAVFGHGRPITDRALERFRELASA